jgi:diacylglycerol kinase family enzyme
VTRALLIFNPEATTVTSRVRDVIAHALDDVVSLDVIETKRPGHATELARDAVSSGKEIVFCLGGDGTLNETLNGLARSDVALAVLPGGGTNVFARTLGLPRDPIEATGVYIERLRDGIEPKKLPLGVLNDRRFAFCAGIGFDAEVVRDVHRRFRAKQRWGEPFFVTTAFRTFFTASERKRTSLRFELPGGRIIEGVGLGIVGRSDPYTFLGSRPLQLTPRVSAEAGLDLLLLRSVKARTVLRAIAGGFRGGRHLKMRACEYEHDLRSFTVASEKPVAVQADGEYLGETTQIVFGTEPAALSVL